MKIATPASPDLQHVAQLLEDMSIAMLTTVESDGALASRPMAALEMDASGALWFFTDLNSAKVDQLQRVNLSFVHMDSGTYVSLSGHGEIVIDRGHIARLWTPFAKP